MNDLNNCNTIEEIQLCLKDYQQQLKQSQLQLSEIESLVEQASNKLKLKELEQSTKERNLYKAEKLGYYTIPSTYYYVTVSGLVRPMYFNSSSKIDKEVMQNRRVFTTRYNAELFAFKTQEIADQLYFKELNDNDYVFKSNDPLYAVTYNNSTEKYQAWEPTICNAPTESVYFSSIEKAEKCADGLNYCHSNLINK